MDSQKSASNTNDLRGKLLRITPNGTNYTIPAHNLFTADATHRYILGLCFHLFFASADFFLPRIESSMKRIELRLRFRPSMFSMF